MPNMKFLEKSRKKIDPGDIFVFQIHRGKYFFGRVIRTDAKIVVFEKCILLYIYRGEYPRSQPVPHLDKEDLLIPPLMTNRMPWRRGYFRTVEKHPLSDEDVLLVHCFRVPQREQYFDEYSRELDRRDEPCGMHVLQSYLTIDDAVSEALGIPLAPDE